VWKNTNIFNVKTGYRRLYVKVKVKFILEHATKTLNLGARWG
jgi:hypothetical protein